MRKLISGGKSTCMYVHGSVVSNSHDSMDGSWPGSSVHGILQARILEWLAISSSRGSSQPRRTPCHWATGEAHRTCRLSNLSCPLSHVAWKPAYSVFGPQAQPLGVSVWPTSWRSDSQSWVLLPSLLISLWTSHITPNVRVLAPAYVCSCSQVGPQVQETDNTKM